MDQPDPATSEIPAWSFFVDQEHNVPRLKGAIAKVIFETNMNEDIERALDKEDESYLE